VAGDPARGEAVEGKVTRNSIILVMLTLMAALATPAAGQCRPVPAAEWELLNAYLDFYNDCISDWQVWSRDVPDEEASIVFREWDRLAGQLRIFRDDYGQIPPESIRMVRQRLREVRDLHESYPGDHYRDGNCGNRVEVLVLHGQWEFFHEPIDDDLTTEDDLKTFRRGREYGDMLVPIVILSCMLGVSGGTSGRGVPFVCHGTRYMTA
jgi:hypothetical protein